MWESTYEVPFAVGVGVDAPIMGSDLKQNAEDVKKYLNEGASNGYSMISFNTGILVMQCNLCHAVDLGITPRCTVHSYLRR